nr:FAD-binding oxidoreductase [Mesotoga prima]
MNYGRLNADLIEELQSLLNIPVKYDEEVSEIMKFANRHLIPVTPRGAATGLSGGAVPSYRGIVMSFEKMNRILKFDEANMMT